MKKFVLMALISVLMGCGGDQAWFSLENAMEGGAAGQRKATIHKSEFKNGLLRISGQCRPDGEILLVLPATERDDRIIGAPKCSRGKYEVRTSTFGRPPCEVIVEYGGNKSAQAKVEGTDAYCP